MCSAAPRQRLGRAGPVHPGGAEAPGHRGPPGWRSRPGRYRDGAATRRGQAVWGGEGARRRRDVVGHTPDAAEREQAHRARLLELVRAERAPLAARQAEPPKTAGALMASRRGGRDRRLAARGRRRLNATQVAAEAKDAGPVVVTTHDDPRAAAEGALGSTSLRRSDGGCRRLQTTGLQTRPIDHGRPHRSIAQVQRWVLAWRLERAAELRGQQTWRTIRQTLDHWQVVRSRRHGTTMVHRTPVTSTMAKILRRLGIPLPQRMLDVSDEAHAASRP